MHYRIEVSPTRKGFARVDFPGRVIALESTGRVGPLWVVEVTDPSGDHEGSVTVRADSASDAVWRVARAVVRAVAELTGGEPDGEIAAASEEYVSNLS